MRSFDMDANEEVSFEDSLRRMPMIQEERGIMNPANKPYLNRRDVMIIEE